MYYNNSYNDSDVVISTDITVSRNLNNYPFPNKMDEVQIASATDEIISAIFKEGNLNKDSWNIITRVTPKSEIEKLLQKGIITENFANNNKNLLAFISNDKSTSIVLCCDDHIKVNVSYKGNVLEDAYGVISKIDNIICGEFKLAFDNALGFLSSDISNLGTAMKALVKLHLPALEKSGDLGEILELVSRIGLKLEKYNETDNSLYTLTNRITMGITEAEAIRNLAAIVSQIITKERYQRIESFS